MCPWGGGVNATSAPRREHMATTGDSESPSLVAAGLLRVRSEFAPCTHMCVVDVTDGHTNEQANLDNKRATKRGGREYVLMVVSDAFEGQGLLQRQRAVMNCFREELHSGDLHALQLKTWTVAQVRVGGCSSLTSLHLLQTATTPSTMLPARVPPPALAVG